jgi:outer membrane protein TolC
MVLTLVLLLGLPISLGAQQPIQLSLKQVVEAALEPDGNTRVQLGQEMVRQAEAQAAQVRAHLLPDLSASVGQQRQTRSLSAMGLQSEGVMEGFQLPRVVGPYNMFDARGTMNQKLFDLSAVKRYQASRTSAEAAKSENQNIKDEAAAEVARFYLAGVRALAVLNTARGNIELSEKLLALANSQKQAGTGTGIEVTRAEVQLANDRQSLLVAKADLTKARLELLKSAGLRLTASVEFADPLSYSEAITRSFQDAMALAHEALPSLKAQKKREQSAGLAHSAVALERVPTLSAFADYGTTGLKASDSQATRTIGVSLHIPIFDGGARDARRSESRSLLKQEQIRSTDLERQVELKIRIALDAVNSAESQVRAAQEGLTLSNNEVDQAQRRYTAGVASSLEITDAQTRLQRARENQISALFNHALARIDLAAATGTIQQLVNNWR